MKRFLLLSVSMALLIGSVILSQSTVNNPHGKLPWDCQDCHTTESWSKMRDTLLFNHAATGFALVGAHAAAQCIGCHKSPIFSNVAVTCVDCHADQHNGALGTECQNCHTPRDWENRRNGLELHAARGFALTGVHAVTDCEACHAGHARQEYAGTPIECYDCHAEDYASTREPNHTQAGFPHDCVTCHQTSSASWLHADFNHSVSFPLTGGHQRVACRECHPSGYKSTSSECYSCHSLDFASTTNPNHETSGFTHECTLCHTIAGWQPAHYDHNGTAFPLTGAHLQVNCVACHVTQYAGTPTACYACHQTNYDQATEPNHQLAAFDHTCTTCHTTTAWQPSSFDHGTTGFTLTGRHLTTVCSACHSTTYAGTPADCYSCHQSSFEGATNPNHVQQVFDHDCTICHTTSGWTPSSFDHANTAFPLTGKHLELTCISCHAGGYSGMATDCYSCHQSAYESTTDPNHIQAGFGHVCTDCHTTSGWSPSSFNHAVTGFTLTGVHLTTSCVSCHASGYSGTPSNCYACHQADYEATTNPNHATAGFPTDCQTCHSTSGWTPSTFDHSATGFVLTGAHLTTSCLSCHAGGYAGTPTDCYSCHQSAFESVVDPNHVQAGFSHVCTGCHTTSAWTPATFDHSTTGFALTGAHVTTPCVSCHASGYTGTPTNCYACHQANYTATTNPGHAAAGFPTDCQTCHSTSGWTPSSWDHDAQYFPIYSGTHNNRWDVCADCHVNSSSYAVFECITCHEHNKTDTDQRHTEVTNYQYLSTACYSCHPRGVSGG
jgi:hypothetical protein